MSSRVVGAGLALIAALLLAVQLATPAVLPVQLALFAGHPTVGGHTRHAQDVYVGLYTAQLCRSDSDVPCKSGQPRTPFRITAYGELAATGVLAVGAVMLALLTLRRSERRKDAARVVRIAGALALLLLGAMVLVAPFTEASTPLGISVDPLLIGMPLYVFGVLGAMLASVIAVRPPPPIKLRVAERAPQTAAPHDVMYANDPTRAADARARRDSRGPIPEPMDPMDPFGASGPLRPLYDATPMQGGTGGLLPMTPSRPSSIPTPYGAEAFGAEPSRPLPFGGAGQPFGTPDAPRGYDARAQSIGADARGPLPPPRSKSASMPPPARTQLSYVPPMPEGVEGDLFAGAEDPLASAPSQLGPPAGFPSAFDQGARFEGGHAYAPPAGHAPAAPGLPYAAAPSAPRVRPETPLAPPPPPSAPWSDDASTFAPPFDPSLDPATGSFDISMEPSEIAPPPVPLIPASLPSQAPPHARTMIQPAAQPTMMQPAAQPPQPAQSSTVTAPPPIPSASRTGPTAPPPIPPGARQSSPLAAQTPAAQAPAPAPSLAAQTPPQPLAAQTPPQPLAAQTPPQPLAAQVPSQHMPVQAPPQPLAVQAPSQPLAVQAPSQPFAAQASPASESVAPAPISGPAPGPSSPPSTLVAAVPPAGPLTTVAPLTRAPRDTQAPRAQRESQAPRPLRAAVPMPARPSQSSSRIPISATRPPPRPTISAPAAPPPAIPPIPPIPIPAIPALPKRPEVYEEAVDGSTAARVPIEISDNNSQTNVSFGIPSADELDAAVADARAARGERPAAPDTSPTGEPVAPQPTPAPAQSRPMPKLPISTAPDTLPPPKDSKQANGPSPACPQCESPMNWVEEHLRFYCKSCRMYF